MAVFGKIRCSFSLERALRATAMLVARKQDKQDRRRIEVLRESNGEFKHLHNVN